MAWWWPWGGKRRKAEEEEEERQMAERSKLSALLTGVMSAVQKASTTAGQQNLHILRRYFDEQSSGKMVPRYTRIEVAPGKVMDIPLLCLMEPSGYRLDELEMDLSLRLQLAEIKSAVEALPDERPLRKGSYHVELCPKDNGRDRRASDVVDVRVRFKACDPAEGLSRIIEDLNNTVTPVDEGRAPDRGDLTSRLRPTDTHQADSQPIVLEDDQALEPQDLPDETDRQSEVDDEPDQP